MRLDHLLSKEEEVRVVLLSSCQSECTNVQMDKARACSMLWTDADLYKSATEHEMKQSGIEGAGAVHERNQTTKMFLVAMRLGETPVPIPNTMVKT